MSSKKLITSALPYVNNAPHLGNIIGCVLSADVYARFCRAMGYETLYICATDEYGTATENKARAEGMTPREICDKYHVIHKEIYKHFNISFDYFGRTSHSEHAEITQSIYKDLEQNGMIEEKETEQTYCEHDEMFLADRYVVGTCPLCGFGDARGDQCDNCGKLLQPTELVDPKCQICGNRPSQKLTKHLYIKLPELEDRLHEFHQSSMTKGNWTNNAVTTTKGWIDNGLLPRPITRDLKWGIKVPRPGYENKVFYVWFDAPIGYISATKRAIPDSWEKWWFDPDNTELYQFMAKDNIPFHTVIFPATLIGTQNKWTLLHHVNATEYLNYENNKFSKSRNIGVFGTDVKASDIHIDLWRFYLLYNRPEKSDANFSWNTFLEDINNNFIDNIGNLLNRVMVFLNKHFEGKLTQVEYTDEQKEFLETVRKEEKEIVSQLEAVKLKEALKGILSLGKSGNKFFQDQEPWATVKVNPELAKTSLTVLICLVRDLGILLSPFMPETADRILNMISKEKVDFNLLGNWDSLMGKTVDKAELLYKKLEQKKIQQYREKFSGSKNDTSEEIKENTWDKILLKVGLIKSVTKHPSADLLYVEEIDCGEENPRTIVSGLVKYYSPEQLIGKKVLIVANLAPADLRGVKSEGMLLVAEKRKKLEIIEIESAAPGTVVLLEGETDHQTSDIITIDEFFAANITVENSIVQMDGKKLLQDGNPIQTQTIEKGKVR